jgi:hypothetical protein
MLPDSRSNHIEVSERKLAMIPIPSVLLGPLTLYIHFRGMGKWLVDYRSTYPLNGTTNTAFNLGNI